ncbi:PorT family protein [bacterium]|nr:PorT family protein [bacterium]
MIKRIASVFMLLFVLPVIRSNAHPKAMIGITGGINISSIVSKPQGLLIISDKTFFGAGPVGEYRFNKNVSMTLGLLVLGKGSKFRIQGQDDLEAAMNLEVLDIPLSAGYTFDTPVIKPYVHAGLFLEYNLKASLRYQRPGSSFTDNIDDEIRDFSSGCTVSGGFKTTTGRFVLFVEAGYFRGFGNLYVKKSGPDYSVSTTGVQVFSGFKYSLGER